MHCNKDRYDCFVRKVVYGLYIALKVPNKNIGALYVKTRDSGNTLSIPHSLCFRYPLIRTWSKIVERQVVMPCAGSRMYLALQPLMIPVRGFWKRTDDFYYDTAQRSPWNMTQCGRCAISPPTPLHITGVDIQSYWLECVYPWLIWSAAANQIAGEMRHWSTSVSPASRLEHLSLWWMIWAAGPLFFHTCHQ